MSAVQRERSRERGVPRVRNAMGCKTAKSLATKPGFKAGVAQLVEHLICNQGVTGSSPVAGTSKINDLASDLRPELVSDRAESAPGQF